MSTETSTGTGPGSGSGTGSADRGRAIAAAVYVLGGFMVGLDATIVNVALPAIADGFDVGVAETGIVDVAYLVSVAAVIPLSGWLGDRYGIKRVYLASFAAFILASAACGAAGNIPALAIARVLQGAAGGLLVPVGMTILYRAYPVEERMKLAKALVIPTALAPTLGPVIGGLLVDHLSWRWGFYLNVPIGAAALLVGARYLTEHREPDAGGFDLRGFLLAAPGFGALMFALNSGATHGWSSPATFIPGVAGLALVTALVPVTLRTERPLVRLGLFADRTFRACSASMVLSVAGFLCVSYVFTLLYQQGLGASASETGLVILPRAMGLMAASQVAQHLNRMLGPGRVVALCMTGAAATFLLVNAIGTGTSPWLVGLLQFAMGFCVGQSSIQLQIVAFTTIDLASTGNASTLYNAQRQIASAVGISMAAGILGSSGAGAGGDLGGYHAAVAVAAGCAVVSALLALLVKTPRPAAAAEDPADPAGADPAPAKA